MNRKKMTMVLVCLLGLSMTQVAWAHRRSPGWHGNVGIYLAPPLWGPRYYRSPYYYAPRYYYSPRPPVYVSPPPPPVYMEQPPAEPTAAPQSYWYFCTEPEGYYPDINECPGGWLKVLPQTQPVP